jgi:hypothetical protein
MTLTDIIGTNHCLNNGGRTLAQFFSTSRYTLSFFISTQRTTKIPISLPRCICIHDYDGSLVAFD